MRISCLGVAIGLLWPCLARAETFSDDFNRADVLGDSYRVVRGNWSVVDQALKAEGKKNKVLLLEGHELADEDFTLAVDFKLENPDDAKCAIGLIFHFQGEGDYCVSRFYGADANFLQFIRVRDRKKGEDKKDKAVQKYPVAGAVKPEAWYRLTVHGYPGGRYEFSLTQRDTDEILANGSGKNPVLSGEGKVGLYVSEPARVAFDNLVFEKP